MLGMSKSELEHAIDSGSWGFGGLLSNIQQQNALKPADILQKMASGIAEAISENNARIERDLVSRRLIR